MSEFTEQLRVAAEEAMGTGYGHLLSVAADEIERLSKAWDAAHQQAMMNGAELRAARELYAREAVTPEAEPTFEMPNAIWLAKFYHDTYERLAPQFSYHTRPESRKFDHESPNGRLMIAVCEELRRALLPQNSER